MVSSTPPNFFVFLCISCPTLTLGCCCFFVLFFGGSIVLPYLGCFISLLIWDLRLFSLTHHNVFETHLCCLRKQFVLFCCCDWMVFCCMDVFWVLCEYKFSFLLSKYPPVRLLGSRVTVIVRNWIFFISTNNI